MADIAHPSGLIAAGLYSNPIPHCDFVTTTTHKTLRGPRGGIIMMGKDFPNPFGLKTPKGKIKMMSTNQYGVASIKTSVGKKKMIIIDFR